MNCRSCRELIQQRLDGLDLDPSPEMEFHLAECARRAALHEASLRLSDGLFSLASPSAPRGLTDRIVADVLADQRAERRRGRVRLAVFALAASLLLGVALAWQAFGGRPAENSSSSFQMADGTKPFSQDATSPASTEPASVSQSVAEAGNTRNDREGSPLDELNVPTGLEPTISYFEAGQGFTVALEPVTNSARCAFDLFRRDLPHVEQTQNP